MEVHYQPQQEIQRMEEREHGKQKNSLTFMCKSIFQSKYHNPKNGKNKKANNDITLISIDECNFSITAKTSFIIKP